jgi:predicted Zn-dependent peptidase
MTLYRKTNLENGTVIVTESVPDVRSVTLGFWIGVGSRNETADENGISHFIEHLLFKGTANRTAKEISETFDTLGAEFNAFTSKEFTCYYTRMLDEHLPIGVEVLSDIMQNSLLAEEHINFERQVVLEEIAMYEDTPDELIHDLFTSALWEKHPLGQQVLGTRATVGAFDRAKIEEYWRRNYGPGNIVVAAAGNLDHDELVRLIEADYRPKATAKVTPFPKEPDISGAVKIFERPTEQVHICYGTAGLNSRHPDRFILSVLENILGGSMSSRLFQKVREEKGLAYSIYSYHSLFLDSGELVVYAGTRPSNVNEVLSIIRKEIDSIKNEGVSPEELARAKDHLKGQMVLSLESTRNRMVRLGKSELTHGELLSIDELVKRVTAVTAEQVRDLARKILDPDRMILTMIGPIKESDLSFK